MYIDMTYIILVLPAVALAMFAQFMVKSTFDRYSKVRSRRGITGAQTARLILDSHGLSNIRIERVAGKLSDHYEDGKKTIRLSNEVYDGISVAALGVAAHEVGHAIQYKQGYAPIRLRNAIIPFTQIGAQLSMPLLILGLILASISSKLIFVAYIGLALYATVAIFQIVTLPSEFDASARAIRQLEAVNVLDRDELVGTKKVLTAAALTYVAALAVTLMQILRFAIILNHRRD